MHKQNLIDEAQILDESKTPAAHLSPYQKLSAKFGDGSDSNSKSNSKSNIGSETGTKKQRKYSHQIDIEHSNMLKKQKAYRTKHEQHSPNFGNRIMPRSMYTQPNEGTFSFMNPNKLGRSTAKNVIGKHA